MPADPLLADWYSVAPYRFPPAEPFSVVRIPVAGPSPFNTLVVVRGRVHLTPPSWSDGRPHRYRTTLRSPFQLGGYQPGTAPEFLHSTTAVLGMAQAAGPTRFTAAVEEVAGTFDAAGRWTVSVESVNTWTGVLAACSAYFSSWVLCSETG